jgi:RNA polymerase sigma factor (sigma-70 family)
MSRGESAPRRNGPTDRVDNLDTQTLRLVIAYLAARTEHRTCVSACEGAWERFYRACDPLFRKLARGRCPGSWSVEDRVQELWRITMERMPQYDHRRDRFPSWLGTVLRNALIDQDRSGHVLSHLDDAAERGIPSRKPDPSAACERAEMRMSVEAAPEELRVTIPETS